jgi:mRNA-degrading endonuclease toxin of MazEF toxin-antitoxin module
LRRSTLTTSGELLPRRGEVWWVRVDKRRPAIVVQTDKVRESRVLTFLVVPLTSRLHLEGLPGNVRLERQATRLPKTSVANVYDVQKVVRFDFLERLTMLPVKQLVEIENGLRLVLDL